MPSLTLHQAPFPHLVRHPSHPTISSVDDCCANKCIRNLESGINHPANEESLFYILTGSSELSLASRWNFNIQQGSRELKRKNSFSAATCPCVFIFRKLACDSVQMHVGRWGGGRGLGLPQCRWSVCSKSNPITREKLTSITANLHF